jgi:hypothetical protein
MNRRISFICAAICCLAVAITISAQSGGGTSDKIQQLEQAMHKAEMQGDASWYQTGLYRGGEACRVPSSRKTIGKTQLPIISSLHTLPKT